jgi:diadenosine tetraphosphate (Ap4A) HIT family hydrolase
MSTRGNSCPFCTLPAERIAGQNEHAVWVRDAYPVSAGHSLVIPRRHVSSFFDISGEERAALLSLLDQAKLRADAEFAPAGYNIGINDGTAAGQTVLHLHVHLIPRFSGDRQDPRGGVRWVLPDKAVYWSRR